MTAMLTTSCGGANGGGRRLGATEVAKSISFRSTTRALLPSKCQARTANKCGKDRACTWTANGVDKLLAPGPRCHPKKSVAHWACRNILTSSACTLNSACMLDGKQCSIKAPRSTLSPTKKPSPSKLPPAKQPTNGKPTKKPTKKRVSRG